MFKTTIQHRSRITSDYVHHRLYDADKSSYANDTYTERSLLLCLRSKPQKWITRENGFFST